jgi:hypothetical protein
MINVRKFSSMDFILSFCSAHQPYTLLSVYNECHQGVYITLHFLLDSYFDIEISVYNALQVCCLIG